MPPVLLGIAAGVAASFLLGATIAGSILIGLSVFYQAYQSERLRNQLSGASRRARQTIRAIVEPAKWRIGTTRSFGMLSQVAWSGRNLQYTVVLGEAPIAGVSRVWVQGRGIPVSGTSTTLTADQALGSGGSEAAMKIDVYLSGAALTSAQHTALTADWRGSADGLRWDTSMQMRSLAFAVIEVYQDEDNSRWRSIPEVSFLTTGFMWASGSGTAKVITNAAEVRRWWEEEREDEPAARIDAAFYRTAVGQCASAGYEVHGTIEADDPHEQVRAALDLAWDGVVVDWGGLLRFLPGAVRTPTITAIPMSDILELPTIDVSRDLHDRVNEATIVLHQSRVADWSLHSLPPVSDTASQTRDGGVLVRDYGTVEYLTNPVTAVNIVRRQILENTGLRVQLTVPYGTDSAPGQYMRLAPGEIVGVALPGLSGKRFRVDATGPAGEDRLTLSLTEEAATRYSATGPAVPAVVATPVQIGPPGAISSLTLHFESRLTCGSVVTSVSSSGGGGGEDDPPLSVSASSGTLCVESDRELVVQWAALADGSTPGTPRDTAIGIDIELFDDVAVGGGGP